MSDLSKLLEVLIRIADAQERIATALETERYKHMPEINLADISGV